MNAPPKFRVDWSQVLAELSRAGYSVTQISYFTGIPITNLLSYRNRDAPSEPAHYRGEALRKFWAESMNCHPDDAPLTEVRISHVVRRC